MRALAGEAVARLPMQSDLAPEPEPPGQALTPLALHALDAFERPRPAFTLQTLGVTAPRDLDDDAADRHDEARDDQESDGVDVHQASAPTVRALKIESRAPRVASARLRGAITHIKARKDAGSSFLDFDDRKRAIPIPMGVARIVCTCPARGFRIVETPPPL